MLTYQIPHQYRIVLLLFALTAFIGPNGMFLYYSFAEPSLINEANANPIALVFMIEAFMLVGLFLGYIWIKTQSVAQVVLYFGLSMIGSLAFSFALFFYLHSKPQPAMG